MELVSNKALQPPDTSSEADFGPLFVSGGTAARPRLARLDATFRDSLKAPLHSWYAYLEGYSPRFVEEVRTHYMPSAQRIFEPFCGTGTTPLVLATGGVSSGYCEVNPLMREVASVKLAVARLDLAARQVLARELRQLSSNLHDDLHRCHGDRDLELTYQACFGRSRFFESENFEIALRLRARVDAMHASGDVLLARLLGVAVAGKLVVCSLLKRAGDVRYKTATELAKGVPNLADAVSEHLRQFASDVVGLAQSTGSAVEVSSDAKKLPRSEAGRYDGVITSPPYLNGTNYIRNTKLELWFHRHIVDESGLRALRDEVVTSGINDVDRNTLVAPPTEAVAALAGRLEAESYDVRISKMVAGYFHDMRLVFSELRLALRPDAPACIDIGDSAYGNIHVATDDLLVEIAEAEGFRLVERVDLRVRYSKGGMRLRQQLLVFRSNPLEKTT